MDVEEREDEYRFYLEMPGMKREDIKLSLIDNVLTITGEKKLNYPGEKYKYHRLERALRDIPAEFFAAPLD